MARWHRAVMPVRLAPNAAYERIVLNGSFDFWPTAAAPPGGTAPGGGCPSTGPMKNAMISTGIGPVIRRADDHLRGKDDLAEGVFGLRICHWGLSSGLYP